MKNLLYKAAAIGASGALVLSMAGPVSADTLGIRRNGAGSRNRINVTYTNGGTTSQSNSGDITTNTTNDADTGDNSTSFNTGGSNSINTGEATATTTVSNTGHLNISSDSCGCDTGDLIVEVDDNGANSDSVGNYTRLNRRNRTQGNTGNLATITRNRGRTSRNNADFNTGGTTSVTTDDATASTTVTNIGHDNE